MSAVDAQAYYWSSTEISIGASFSYLLDYGSGSLSVINYVKYYGFQVRCVK
jgi:uncharacterized protein (TIGR02145 family)